MESIIKRQYTKGLKDGQSVFELFNWIKRDITLHNFQTGEVIYECKGAEFPDFYSENACNIIASKYFYRAVPETSLKQVVDRMCWFWTEALKDEGLVKTDEEASIIYDELAYTIISQIWAPNSPQWFNSGLKKYGIEADHDYTYYYDPDKNKVVRSKDRYTRSQSSACFIIPIKDKLLGTESISDHYAIETKLFKGGSGVGTNFSNIRAEGERLSSGGKSSGVMSFLLGLDRNAGAIKSGGTTRRAAKMVVLDVNHPEIEDFVEWKALEEDKVRALGKAGYDTSMNGEAYKTVSGQNSNNSVRVDHEFMTKKNDPEADYTLYGLTDPEVNKTVKAYDLWKKINEAAWKCADPGLQFSDTINAWNTCLNDDIIRASNPCSEFVFLDNTACNLASINLLKFLNKDGSFDIDSFLHIIGLVQLVLEASIHWGQYPTKAVAERSYLYRPTGLGLTNYASLFLAMGLAYDSDEARALAATLTGIMTGYSYCVSTKMAKEIGPFEKYEYNKTSMLDVICNHAIVAGCPPYSKCIDNGFLNIQPLKVDREKVPKDLSECLNKVWCRAFNDGQRYGFRNSQVSCIAPTGTISFAMDCGATSIEPFFSHKVYKKCSDGTTMEIINPLADEYLSSKSYPILKLQDIENYFNENNTYQGCPELTEHDQKVLETANEVSPEAHVKMVAAVTPLISGAVSKTINLPNSATVEDIMAINDLAYKLGVKAITVYRDGCKASQPLNTSIDEDDKEEEIEETKTRAVPERIKPSPIRNSRTHVVQIESLNLYITVGYYDNGDLAELFISTDKEGTTIKGLLSALSKAISYMLQFGIEPQEISKMLRGHKFEPAGIVAKHPNIKFVDSIADLISKIIDIECGNYNYVQVKDEINKPVFIKEPKEIEEEPERIYGETCPNCGSSNLVKTGVCKTCNDCGSTTGCS